MTSTCEVVAPAECQSELFRQTDSYSWDTDEEFSSGLSAILGSTTSQEQAVELTLRARCFFYARKVGTPIDFEGYKAWRALNTAITSSEINEAAPNAMIPSDEPDSGPKFSYQEIVDLIQNGKPIPGIREIPKTVLEGQGTAAKKLARRKPWERDETPPQPVEPADGRGQTIELQGRPQVELDKQSNIQRSRPQ